jgi:hypothetical protein
MELLERPAPSSAWVDRHFCLGETRGQARPDGILRLGSRGNNANNVSAILASENGQ